MARAPRADAAEREELMTSGSGGANITVMWRDEPRVNLCENKFPKAIVWGPLGCITCCIPVVGHMGIADSKGVIHDFAGPYAIGIDEFMVQCVWRYAVVPSNDDDAWDAAIEKADDVYRERMHDICCDNCHHHTALALNHAGLPVGPRGLLSAWFYCCLHGRCTWWHCLYCSDRPAPPSPNMFQLVNGGAAVAPLGRPRDV